MILRDRVFPIILIAASALAQPAAQPTSETEKKCSISGTARREGSDTPLPGVIVSVATHSRFANGTIYMSIANSKRIETVTDEQGRYRLADLPQGNYRIFARTSERRSIRETGRMATLRAGENLSSIDLSFPAEGSISGRVLDHNDEPIQGAAVLLIYREYSRGRNEHFVRATTNTTDTGAYTFPHVEAGRPYLLMARVPSIIKGTEVPADPALRKPIPVPTYFPNSTSVAGAAPIVLRSEERREGVDFVVRRAPSFCISGIAEAAGEGRGSIQIAGGEISGDGGNIRSGAPSFPVEADGKFHACGLPAGDYRLMAWFQNRSDRNSPAQVGWGRVTITKEDVTGLRLYATSGVPVRGRVEWDGPAPEQPPTARAVVALQELGRIGLPGEQSSAVVSIPSEFVLANVFLGDYIARPSVNSTSIYVKDVFYGANSVLRDALQISGGPGDLRVVLARDGATIAAKVADKDGNPVSDIKVVIMPAVVRSEADLPDAWALGETDQDGTYSYGPLRPGKYLIFATAARVDRSVESVNKVWNARSHLETIELGPNGQVQVTLTPVAIE